MGQEEVTGASGLPDTDLDLSGNEDFILLLGQSVHIAISVDSKLDCLLLV